MSNGEPTPEKLSLEENVESLKSEILKEKTDEEFLKMLHDVEKLLLREHEEGGGKLQEKIGEIENDEVFTDGRIRYIPKIEGATVKVFSDTHGETQAIKNQLDEFIKDKELGENKIHLASLGDMTNIGPEQIKNVTIFLELKNRYPEFIHLLKGNCEMSYLGMAAEGLNMEMWEKYGLKQIERIHSDLFFALDQLPDYLVFGNGAIMTHGGPPKEPVSGLIELNKKGEDLKEFEEWSDINPNIEDVQLSTRRDVSGGVYEHGEKSISRFLGSVGASVFLRGHQKLPGVKEEGFEVDFGGKCGTFMSSEQPEFVERPDGLYAKVPKVKEPRIFEMSLDKLIDRLEESMFKKIE